MIIKELDPFFGTEPFELAGRRAEEQMAFYLRREFSEIEDAYVINGLRLERKGDACQIDHLIVHRCGFFIIESKSVTTEVRIDDKGNWSRLVDGVWRGMGSPINQAKLQITLLKNILNDYAPTVLGKMLGLDALQMRFGGLTYDPYAAISDNGIIDYAGNDTTICKADGICERIKGRLEYYNANAGLLGFAKNLFKSLKNDDTKIRYPDDIMRKVADHLVSLHKPLERAEPKPAVKAPVTSAVLILPENTPPNPTPESTSACCECGTRLSPRVMDFCRGSPNRFAGRLYCMGCQKNY